MDVFTAVRTSSPRRPAELVASAFVACCVGGVAWRAPQLAPKIVVAIVVVLALRVAVAHLRAATVLMLVFVPLQQPALAYLHARGAPDALVRNLGFYKEFVTVAAVIAAVQVSRSRPWRLRALDALVLGYVSIVGAFLLAPVLLPGTLGGQAFSVRLTGFRSFALFLIIFFAFRRLPWTAADVRIFSRALVVAAVANAGTVLWERYANDGFVRFTLQTLRRPDYYRDVLGLPVSDTFAPLSLTQAGPSGLRAAGWLFDASATAFLCVIALTLVIRWLIERRPHPWLWIAAPVLALALALTLTRSGVLAGVLGGLLVVTAAARFRLPGRVRIGLVLMIGALLIAPFIGSSGLANRVSGALAGTDQSAAGHGAGSSAALDFVLHHPAGVGLATRTQDINEEGQPLAAAENTYLEIGVELGVLPMLMFVGIVILTQKELGRSRGDGSTPETTSLWAAGWALAANGMFLSVWLPFAVSMTFWPLAAAALVASQEAHAEALAVP